MLACCIGEHHNSKITARLSEVLSMQPHPCRSLLVMGALTPMVALAVARGPARADTFGSGPNTFDIEFVTIGDPSNPADTTGDPSLAGSVDYVYRIGKFEVSRAMVTKASAEGDLEITLDPIRPLANTLITE